MSAPPGSKTPQGLGSSTWTAPNCKSPESIPALVDHHLSHSAGHIYATTTRGRAISTLEFLRAAHRAGAYLQARVSRYTEDRVIGILAEPEAFLVATTVLGAICAGFVPLVLSPRNSWAAIADLCKKCECGVLWYSRQSAALSKVAKAAQDELLREEIPLELFDMPDLSLLFPCFGRESRNDAFEPLPMPRGSTEDRCLILHSSGSTSFPKPIAWSHRFALKAGLWPWYGNKDICGRSWFVGASPTFHMAGILNHIIVPLVTGVTICLFDPSEKAWPPSSDSIIDAVRRVRPADVSVVPSFLEEWASDKQAVAVLKSCERVIFGGGPLSKEVGDRLVDQGVVLSQIYGATEFGVTNEIIDKATRDWMWLRTSSQVKLRLEPVEGDDTFILQVLSTDRHEVAVRNINGTDAYDTRDLVRQHPAEPSLLQIVGRADSQIMMANGEKTNPEPIEHLIERHPLVDKAVMFGRGRPACGVLVQPTAAGFDRMPSELLDAIWHYIEKANASSPQHSRIFRDLVLLADRERPFELTAKLAVRRHKVLEAYAEDIKRAYQADVAIDASQSNNDLGTAISNIVKAVLNVDDVQSDTNLFSIGCDSLQATHIQRRLAHLANGQKFPPNLVYLAPSIAQLQDRLAGQNALADTSQQKLLEQLSHLSAMEDAIRRHTTGLSKSVPATAAPANGTAGETVVVTGTTGGLGSLVLASLLADSNVSNIYALNRKAAGKSLLERQRAAFSTRSLDVPALTSDRLHLVEADISRPDLGLSSRILLDMSRSVTLVLHTAWRVNFAHALDGFESDLQSLRNLIDFAAGCGHRPHFVFTSSIASLANWPCTRWGPERLPDHSILAVGQGYGESKYVAERMLEITSQGTGLQTTVIRIGQLSGTSTTGAWSTSEWFPALVKSSETLQCLPSGRDCVAWIPIDKAASIVHDIALSAPSEAYNFYNLAHPQPVPYNCLIEPIAKILRVPLVPYKEWLLQLENSAAGDADIASNPALLLLDMFKRSCISDQPRTAQEALDMPRLETTQAESISETLRGLQPLSGDDAKHYVQHWYRVGFLTRSTPRGG